MIIAHSTTKHLAIDVPLPHFGKPHVLWDGEPVALHLFGTDHWHLLREVADASRALGGYVPVDNLSMRRFWWDGGTLLRTAELEGHTDYDVIDDHILAGHLAYVWEGASLSSRSADERSSSTWTQKPRPGARRPA